MLNILIVDDNSQKVAQIINVINEFPEASHFKVDTALDCVSARKYLTETVYDVLILDMWLPERLGDDAKKDGGVQLLDELNQSIRMMKPFHIIGLTAYDDLAATYRERFLNDLWLIIYYDATADAWKEQLKNKIKYLIQSKRSVMGGCCSQYDYDIGVVVALPDVELASILKLPANWETYKLDHDATFYSSGIIRNNGRSLKIVVAATHQMGMIATAVLSMKLISNFHPRYLAMTGITAGVKGKGNIGDILVAESSWDYGSGKFVPGEGGGINFLPDPKYLPIDIEIKELFLKARTERRYLDEIRSQWRGPKPSSSLELIVGPIASGAAVVADDRFINDILNHNRKLVGVDMETYGIYYAANNANKPLPKCFSIKSICDFADSRKGDKYQAYAAYTSAEYFCRFSLDMLP